MRRVNTAFQAWLATIDFQGTVCAAPRPPGGGGGPPGGGGPRQTVPGAPTNLVADGGNEQVTLSWDAPENDGGFAIIAEIAAESLFSTEALKDPPGVELLRNRSLLRNPWS